MQATKEKPNSNGHVSPVLAAVLDCFQSPPTTAYRAPHQDHPGREKMAAAILNAEDVIDPSRSAPAREFVGNELHNTPTSSSPREEAGNQGRTAAPALAHWSERCTIVQRSSKGRTTGFDVISPSGKHWLLADARAWGNTWPNMTLGAHQTVDAACRAVAIAPSPPDAFSPVTSTVYVARPKDAGAMSRQETIVRQARENNCTEKAADEKHGDTSRREQLAAVIKAQRNAYERGARDLTEYLRTAMRDARTIADAERWIRNLAPWCPSCGDPMTREAASPADPSVGIFQATPAHWVCCGVGIKDGDGQIAPEDNKIPASAVVAA